MQYVSVKFKKGRCMYTYRNPFQPVKVGAKVEITTRQGDEVFKVLAITDTAQSFQTQPIKRIV